MIQVGRMLAGKIGEITLSSVHAAVYASCADFGNHPDNRAKALFDYLT